MKVIISILAMEARHYPLLDSAVRKTWYNLNEENHKIFFYYGNREKNEIVGENIYTTFDEGLYGCGHRTIAMLELLYNEYEFDYIFRTTLSSYVDIKKMTEFLNDKPKDNFYCGVIGDFYGIPFCSGSGYFLSRNLVKLILDNKNLWNHEYIDDVALGILMKNFGVPMVEGERQNVVSNSPLPYEEFDLNNYHFRLKSSNVNVETDITNMINLYNIKK